MPHKDADGIALAPTSQKATRIASQCTAVEPSQREELADFWPPRHFADHSRWIPMEGKAKDVLGEPPSALGSIDLIQRC